MSTIYKRVGINLHYFKDKKIIDFIDDKKEKTNLSYSDILRLIILETMEKEGCKPQEVKPLGNSNSSNNSNENKKPKFKFEG